MPNVESVRRFLEANELSQIHAENARRRRVQQTASVAQVVEGLSEYETWRALVAAKRDDSTKLRDSAISRMLTGSPAPGETLSDFMLKQRLLFAEAAGATAAFETALSLIPNAVKAGDQSP